MDSILQGGVISSAFTVKKIGQRSITMTNGQSAPGFVTIPDNCFAVILDVVMFNPSGDSNYHLYISTKDGSGPIITASCHSGGAAEFVPVKARIIFSKHESSWIVGRKDGKYYCYVIAYPDVLHLTSVVGKKIDIEQTLYAVIGDEP